MKVIKVLANARGISLVEVMMAVAISGGLALTIAKFMENSSQNVKQIEAKSESINLKNVIQNILSNSDACKFTFNPLITQANLTTLTANPSNSVVLPGVKDKTNTIVYSTASTKIRPLTITSMVLTNYNSAAGTGDLLIQSTFQRSASQIQPVKPIRIIINFNINNTIPAAPVLTTCSSSAVDSGAGWELTGNASTVEGTNFIGTTDNVDLVLRRNNLETVRLSSTGSIEIGTDNNIQNTYAFAQGRENYVSGRYGFGAGYLNNVTAESASALGKGNVAKGINSHAAGELNEASGLSSTAHGYYNLSSGSYSFASGYNSTASGVASTALGNTSVASGHNALAAGGATASGGSSFAFGSGATATQSASVAFNGSAKAIHSFAFGLGATSNAYYSVAIGRDALTGSNASPNTTVGVYSTAIGAFASATEDYALALSVGGATASAEKSMAIGEGVFATAYRSIAIGLQAKASGTGANIAVGGNLHQSHRGSMFGYNPWATTLSRADHITTIFGPGIDLCTATNVANNGAPEYGSICQSTATVSIGRTNNHPAAEYPRFGIGYASTTSTLAVNCTGNTGLCATKSDGTTTWNIPSDRRLKTIEKKYKVGLKEILKVSPVYYRYKDNQKLGLSSEKLNVGIVAQELQPLIPDAITKNPDGYLTFQSDSVLWGTVNSIKELNNEIVKLKEENHELKQALCELHPELKACKNKK